MVGLWVWWSEGEQNMLWVFTSLEWTKGQQQSVEDWRYCFNFIFLSLSCTYIAYLTCGKASYTLEFTWEDLLAIWNHFSMLLPQTVFMPKILAVCQKSHYIALQCISLYWFCNMRKKLLYMVCSRLFITNAKVPAGYICSFLCWAQALLGLPSDKPLA